MLLNCRSLLCLDWVLTKFNTRLRQYIYLPRKFRNNIYEKHNKHANIGRTKVGVCRSIFLEMLSGMLNPSRPQDLRLMLILRRPQQCTMHRRIPVLNMRVLDMMGTDWKPRMMNP